MAITRHFKGPCLPPAPVKASVVIERAQMAGMKLGVLEPAATVTTGQAICGLAKEYVSTMDGATDKTLEIDPSPALLDYDTAGGDALTWAEFNTTVYAMSGTKVGKTNGGATRSAAGTLIGFADGKVLVRFPVQ